MMKRDTAKAANAVDIQKYERGTNRVSASKLYEIARCLQAPVAYFFEGIGEGTQVPEYAPPVETSVHEFLLTPEGIELAKTFPKVRRGPLRRRILEMVRTLAEEADFEAV